jgi:uncharacterized protein (DUF1778 family)
MRTRPQLVTTVSADHYELLKQAAEEDERPLSFVVDKAIGLWAIAREAKKTIEVPA